MFHCAVKSYNGEHFHKKNGRSAQYAFECCKENMCNENQEFPVLPVCTNHRVLINLYCLHFYLANV